MIIHSIAVHHGGGKTNFEKTQHQTWQFVNEFQRQKWNFRSSLGFYGGYNFWINADGTWKQFRAIGEITAAQLYKNEGIVSIALAGNFVKESGERPTQAQMTTLLDIMWAIMNNRLNDLGIVKTPDAIINIKIQNILPHRYWNFTQCWGFPPDNWARNLYIEQVKQKLTAMQKMLLSFLDASRGVKFGWQRLEVKLGAKVATSCLEDNSYDG